MRKIGFILIIGLSLRFIVSCCDCNDTTVYKYTFNSMKTMHIDNSGQSPHYVEGGIIPKEAYGLQIELALSQLAYNKSLNFTGFNTAYAFDCFCPPEIAYFAQDTISEIRIITLNDFDITHKANSEISDYFKVLTSTNYLTIPAYVDTPEIIYYEKPEHDIILVYLMKPPAIIGEHRFKVEILLSDGTTLASSTTIINLE